MSCHHMFLRSRSSSASVPDTMCRYTRCPLRPASTPSLLSKAPGRKLSRFPSSHICRRATGTLRSVPFSTSTPHHITQPAWDCAIPQFSVLQHINGCMTCCFSQTHAEYARCDDDVCRMMCLSSPPPVQQQCNEHLCMQCRRSKTDRGQQHVSQLTLGPTHTCQLVRGHCWHLAQDSCSGAGALK